MKHRTQLILSGAGIFGSWLFAGTADASGVSVMPDQSLIWQIVNFLVLIWILNFVLYRPIRNVIAQRKEKMEGLDKSIQNFEEDALKKEEAHIEGIEAAKSNGKREKTALIEEATAEERKIIEEINRETQKTISENKEKIARDVESAAADLLAKVDGFAAEIGRKVLGREIA